jgi:hypothetical protein
MSRVFSERPLGRVIVKFGCEIIRGKRRGHMHAWWPGLALERPDGAGVRGIRYRGRAVGEFLPTAILRRRAGPAVCIVGSGPSVRDTAVSELPASSALVLNGAVSLVGEGIAQPLAVAVEDERFIWRHFALLRERVARDVVLVLSVSAIRAICERDPCFLRGRPLVLNDDIRKPYAADRRELGKLQHVEHAVVDIATGAGISLEPDRGVFHGGSVAVSTLQFALACRPRSIGLVGIDLANANGPRFYERSGEVARSGIVRAQQRIVDHILLARRVAARYGVVVVNHSAVSTLIPAGIGYDARYSLIGTPHLG